MDVKWKGDIAVRYEAKYMTFPFDHTHDLGLEFSRSMFELALSQESMGVQAFWIWIEYNDQLITYTVSWCDCFLIRPCCAIH